MGKNPKEFIVFGKPKLSESDITSVINTLKSGWIGRGPVSLKFEESFAKYQNVKHAHAVSSCSSALMIALRAVGVKPGDEVITTSMTFAATVRSILETGATPVLVDVDPETGLMDLSQVEEKISPNTKAIIPVHLYGAIVPINELMYLRKKYGIPIIHDCAHAIESKWDGKFLSEFPDVTCFSFYSTKNLTTIEGGMICSNDDLFMERCRLLSSQGMTSDAWKRFSNVGYKHYDVTTMGFKLNFTDTQAALGLSQLESIEAKWKIRSALWSEYVQTAKSHKEYFILPAEMSSQHRHAYHLFTLRVKENLGRTRDEVLTFLQGEGIGCGVHYRSILDLSYFRKVLKKSSDDFPNARDIGMTTFSVPFTPYLSKEEIERITETLKMLPPQVSLKKVA